VEKLAHRKYVLTEEGRYGDFEVSGRRRMKQAEWDYENGY
jgi:hypothetical protein